MADARMPLCERKFCYSFSTLAKARVERGILTSVGYSYAKGIPGHVLDPDGMPGKKRHLLQKSFTDPVLGGVMKLKTTEKSNA
jgi:hypothetical protein